MEVWIIILVMISLYLLPGITALRRNVPNALTVVVINVLLGWTFIGWVIALAWAVSDSRKRK